MQRARIAARAYTLWERRGKPEGSPEIDWDAAEKELAADASTKPNATQQAADVLTSDSDRGPVATHTKSAPFSGRFRASSSEQKPLRQVRDDEPSRG